jgi:dynein heavy chain
VIEDLADGQYLVKYVGDVPGEYNIEVKYVNEDAVGESIRGFPSKSTFTDQGKAEDNDFTGKLVVDYLQKKLVELDKWTSVNSAGIETQGTDYDTNVKTLLSVKEHIQKINESKHKNLLDLEIIEQILKNFEKAKTPRNKDAEFCNKLIRELNSLEKRGEATEKLIQTNIKSEASKRKDEIKQFEDILKNYLLQLKTKAMYKYATGCEAAQAEMEIVNSIVEQYKVSFDDYDYYAKMFEYPEVIEQAKKNLEMISKDTGSIKGLWFQIKKIQD